MRLRWRGQRATERGRARERSTNHIIYSTICSQRHSQIHRGTERDPNCATDMNQHVTRLSSFLVCQTAGGSTVTATAEGSTVLPERTCRSHRVRLHQAEQRSMHTSLPVFLIFSSTSSYVAVVGWTMTVCFSKLTSYDSSPASVLVQHPSHPQQRRSSSSSSSIYLWPPATHLQLCSTRGSRHLSTHCTSSISGPSANLASLNSALLGITPLGQPASQPAS
jgi:hypothetical protein